MKFIDILLSRKYLLITFVFAFVSSNYSNWFIVAYANEGRIRILHAMSDLSRQNSDFGQLDEGNRLEISQALSILHMANELAQSPIATDTISQVYNLQGDWAKTVDLLDGLDPNYPVERQELLVVIKSSALVNLGQYAEAELLWRSNSQSRQAVLFLYEQAHDLLKEGRIEEAQDMVHRADRIFVEPHARKVPVYQALCIRLRDTPHKADAVYWCQKLTEVNSRAGSYLLLGRAYLAAEQYTNAVEVLKIAIDRGGGAPAWNYLGNAYQSKGEWELAQDAYRESIRQDPEYVYGRLSLADLYAHIGWSDEAIIEYEALRGKFSDNLLDARIKRLTTEEK